METIERAQGVGGGRARTVRRSIFSTRVSNLHAMWAVWQSRTGE